MFITKMSMSMSIVEELCEQSLKEIANEQNVHYGQNEKYKHKTVLLQEHKSRIKGPNPCDKWHKPPWGEVIISCGTRSSS
jgi:hypothetical protein